MLFVTDEVELYMIRWRSSLNLESKLKMNSRAVVLDVLGELFRQTRIVSSYALPQCLIIIRPLHEARKVSKNEFRYRFLGTTKLYRFQMLNTMTIGESSVSETLSVSKYKH